MPLQVFDVGANVGEFSEHVLQNCSQAVVHAFEPNIRHCSAKLGQLAARYGERFILSFQALGTHSGSGELFGGNLMNGQIGSLNVLNLDSEGWQLQFEQSKFTSKSVDSESVEVCSIKDLSSQLSLKQIN